MNKYTSGLPEEDILPTLRALYSSHGFIRYRMSKFEEYGLYSGNRDFLGGGDIITFSDFGGRLMALRPDVTLSIAKGVRECDLPAAVYYCENVYRRAKGTRDVKELLQTGLEYIGRTDDNITSQVIYLAYKSLAALSECFVLDISHMGFISAVFSECGIDEGLSRELLSCIGEKNSHRLYGLCSENGLSDTVRDRLMTLISVSGHAPEVFGKIKHLCAGEASAAAYNELVSVYGKLEKLSASENIRIDFSVINDMSYYNGVIFDGFIKGIPHRVLSGGSYGSLLKKLGKNADAIGFAVQLGEYGEYAKERREYDFDLFIAYTESTPDGEIAKAVLDAESKGLTYRTGHESECNVRCREIIRLK